MKPHASAGFRLCCERRPRYPCLKRSPRSNSQIGRQPHYRGCRSIFAARRQPRRLGNPQVGHPALFCRASPFRSKILDEDTIFK
jgi:hypothetical protein